MSSYESEFTMSSDERPVTPVTDAAMTLRDEPMDIVAAMAGLPTLFSTQRRRMRRTGAALPPIEAWRSTERGRTVAVGLVMCINIGTDPPDVLRVSPCARLEAWTDPLSAPPQKAIEQIGYNLQFQYSRWQLRAKYRTVMDATVDDVRKLAASLRRNARDDRVLFHYNGHGVPRPTRNGEIWLFNSHYTQYMPLSVYDLQAWCGSPTMFVFDCCSAGVLLHHFTKVPDEVSAQIDAFARPAGETTDAETEAEPGGHAPSSGEQREFLVLCACSPGESLPTSPDLPADLFTACLTTPIKMALRWFCLRNPLVLQRLGGDLNVLDQIPGAMDKRKTPIGELNWIFTAITDSIVWSVLPKPLFQRLFRQDLMVASLFRNFVLAERIMKYYHCTPQSSPELPPTANHHLWDAWDVAVDLMLAQMPAMLGQTPLAELGAPASPVANGTASVVGGHAAPATPRTAVGDDAGTDVPPAGRRRRGSSSSGSSIRQPPAAGAAAAAAATAGAAAGVGPAGAAGAACPPYQSSPFFKEQLTAFEVWLPIATQSQAGPEQLPIILQVLLSQTHRARSLCLLARFVDLGPWAANLTLIVGVFPYVLKLLQSISPELRHMLVFLWAKIIALDRSCQTDLLHNRGHMYFCEHLISGPYLDGNPPVPTELMRIYTASQIIRLACGPAPGTVPVAAEELPPYVANRLSVPPNLPRCEGDILSFDQRWMAAFVLTMILKGNRAAQANCLSGQMHKRIATALIDGDARLRLWTCLCLAQLWEGNEEARMVMVNSFMPDHLLPLMLADKNADVRAAAAVAIGGLLRGDDARGASDADDYDLTYGFEATATQADRFSAVAANVNRTYIHAAWQLAYDAACDHPPRQAEAAHHADGVATTASMDGPGLRSPLRVVSSDPDFQHAHGGGAFRDPRDGVREGRDARPKPRLIISASSPALAAPLAPVADANHLPSRAPSRAVMELGMAVPLTFSCLDASAAVRRESLLAVSRFVVQKRHAIAMRVVATCWRIHRAEKPRAGGDGAEAPVDVSHAPKTDDIMENVFSVVNLWETMAADGTARPTNAGQAGGAAAAAAAAARSRRNTETLISVHGGEPQLSAVVRAAGQQVRLFRGSHHHDGARSAGGSSGPHVHGGAMSGSSMDTDSEASALEAFPPDPIGIHWVSQYVTDPALALCVQALGERGALYFMVWRTLLRLQSDPAPEVSNIAKLLVSQIRQQLIWYAEHLDDSVELERSAAHTGSMHGSQSMGDLPSGIHHQRNGSNPSVSGSVTGGAGARFASLAQLNLVSTFIDAMAATLHEPCLSESPDEADAWSAERRDHAQRQRQLQDALREAIALGISAHRDPRQALAEAVERVVMRHPSARGMTAPTPGPAILADTAGVENMYDAVTGDALSPRVIAGGLASTLGGGGFFDAFEVAAAPAPPTGPTALNVVASLSAAELDTAVASLRKFSQKAALENDGKIPGFVLFHPYDTTLVVADTMDGLCTWNYVEGRRGTTFANTGNPKLRVTSMDWVNEHDECLLLTGANDGSVRLWDSRQDDHQMVTSFCALPEIVRTVRSGGLICKWLPGTGHLAAAGSAKCLRLWDLQSEQCIAKCDLNLGSHIVTSMTAPWPGTPRTPLVMGTSHGAILVMDPRTRWRRGGVLALTDHVLPPVDTATRMMREHINWLASVTMARAGGPLLYSGSISGSIKFWDIRSNHSIKSIDGHASDLTALVVHDFAPVLASGTKQREVKIWHSLTGEQLGSIKHLQGFLGQRLGPVSCLDFHPYRMLLAAGATDSIVSIHTGQAR